MNKELQKLFEFRYVMPEEFEQVNLIEHTCFPPHEACAPKSMKERVEFAADFFLVAMDRETGKLAGMLTGVGTDEDAFRDEFFTDISLCSRNGRNVMLLSLAVLPEYQRRGLAREIVSVYAANERAKGRSALYLTCLPEKVSMYESFGFEDRGICSSNWGGEKWHEMLLKL